VRKRKVPREGPERPTRAHSLTPIKSEKIKKIIREDPDGTEVGELGLKSKSVGARGNGGKDPKDEESKKSKERRKRLDEFKLKLKKQRSKSKEQR